MRPQHPASEPAMHGFRYTKKHPNSRVMYFIGLKATIQAMQIQEISDTCSDWWFASRKSMQFPVVL